MRRPSGLLSLGLGFEACPSAPRLLSFPSTIHSPLPLFFFSFMGPTVLTSFADLPNELSSRIVDLACRNATSAEAAPSALDVPTLLNLTLVSRHLYPILVEKLYCRIRITTISALRSLALALVSRPALGRCIKSLHLGPEDNLPEDWTPIFYEAGGEGQESEGVMCLATSLDHQQGDADRLPRWCLPCQHWPAEGSAASKKTDSSASCRHQAIVEAVQSAVTTLNVAPGRPHEDASGESIGRVRRRANASMAALRIQADHPCRTLGRLGCTTMYGSSSAGSLPRPSAQDRAPNLIKSGAPPRPA